MRPETLSANNLSPRLPRRKRAAQSPLACMPCTAYVYGDDATALWLPPRGERLQRHRLEDSDLADHWLTNPVFLVGAERSGTTLLRLILDHHPLISFHEEFEYVVSQIDGNGCPPDLAAYYEFLELDRNFRWDGFRVDRTLSYPSLVNSFLEQSNHHHKPVVGATVHFGFQHLPSLWPKSRFIHLTRDPRDVVSSRLRLGWEGNAWTAAAAWRRAEEEWNKLEATVPRDRWIQVRFEELVQDTAPTLQRLCSFLGVPFDQKMLSYPEDTTYAPIDRNLKRQWPLTLSPRSVVLVESALSGLMESRGYLPSASDAKSIGKALRLVLVAHDRAVRVKHRVRRQGAGLVAQQWLARLLRHRSWERRIRLRLHEITNKNLK